MLATNLTIRFLLELGALGAVGAWGFSAGASSLGRVALGIGVPLLLATFWAMFVGPGATTPEALKVVLAFAVFTIAAAALAAQHHGALAATFVAVAAVNATFLQILEN
jgi:F0F1-type ATP synthase assembly protein I